MKREKYIEDSSVFEYSIDKDETLKLINAFGYEEAREIMHKISLNISELKCISEIQLYRANLAINKISEMYTHALMLEMDENESDITDNEV